MINNNKFLILFINFYLKNVYYKSYGVSVKNKSSKSLYLDLCKSNSLNTGSTWYGNAAGATGAACAADAADAAGATGNVSIGNNNSSLCNIFVFILAMICFFTSLSSSSLVLDKTTVLIKFKSIKVIIIECLSNKCLAK